MGVAIVTLQMGPLDLTLTVDDPSVFNYPTTLNIDAEMMYALSALGNVITLDPNGRGYVGTAPGIHLVGSSVCNAPTIVGTPNGITLPPYTHSRKVGEQWDLCDRCGFAYPMSKLVKQKGLLICMKHCFDNLEVERRQQEIMKVLGAGVQQEGADLRVIDRSFWIRSDEEVT